MFAKSIDVYLTYKCNLRCTHCFVGNFLKLNTDFDFALLQRLVRACTQWKTEEITFLGGEPTLYSRLGEAISLVQANSMGARVVTNGLDSFNKFISTYKNEVLPIICFSIDGGDELTVDKIRGRGTFRKLISNIEKSSRLGYLASGIVSLSKDNIEDVFNIIKLCEKLGLQYINVHYVTNRGFAQDNIVPTIKEWINTYQKIIAISKEVNIEIRVEETFTPQSLFQGSCAVRESNNLMFFPDKKVYMCTMFIDQPESNSFFWTEDGLIPNDHPNSEANLAREILAEHCPAMKYVNSKIYNTAKDEHYAIKCIYEKTHLKRNIKADKF